MTGSVAASRTLGVVLSFVNTFPGADDVGNMDCQHDTSIKITINVLLVLSFSSILVSSETELAENFARLLGRT